MFQLPLVSLLHKRQNLVPPTPEPSAQEDAQWQIRSDRADKEFHDPLQQLISLSTWETQGLDYRISDSDWQEPGPRAPRAWNSPYIKTSWDFYSLDYTVKGDLEIYILLGIWKINCFQTLLQCLCKGLRTGRDLASCATSHRSCILELALLWNNWNFLQAEVCTQSSVFPCKHTTAPLLFNYQKPAPAIYQAWHSIHLCC